MTFRNPITTVQQHGLKLPGTLTIAITGACNLACRHCWVDAGGQSASSHVPGHVVRRIIGEFAALGGKGLRLTGGEPLCHPEWPDLMRLFRSLDFHELSLQTNGMLFSDEYVSLLSELDFAGLSIQISLDGASAATHDQVRGAGAFEGALDGVRKLVHAGLAQRISLFFTEMRHNLEDIPALLEYADSMGIASVKSGTVVLCGRAAKTENAVSPGIEQYQMLLERYNADSRFRELYQRIGRVAALEWQTGTSVREECCTFIENPYLTPSGRLYPCLMCHADDYSVAGVFEKGLAASLVEGAPLWSALLRISRRRPEHIADCRDCRVKPFCAGGCMGRAWGSCGSLLAADDRCDVRRALYDTHVNPAVEPHNDVTSQH